MPLNEVPENLRRQCYVSLQNVGAALVLAKLTVFIISWGIDVCLLYILSSIFLSSVWILFVEDWRPKPKVSTNGKAVFITGCGSGFGYDLAQRLDSLGFVVFAACHFPEKDGPQRLKSSCSDRLHLLPLEVKSEESVKNVVNYVERNIGENKLWALVNNAGLNAGGEIAWTNIEVMQHVVDVNTFGMIRVTKAFLPLLIKNKGRIVTVASAAGRVTVPIMVPYCISKHADISFCDGLRIEVHRFGIKVITVEPFFYKTPITNEESIQNYILKEWNDSSIENKQFFPQNYMELIKQSFHYIIEKFTSDNVFEVVDCIEEALMAEDPKYSYKAGTLLSRLIFWIGMRIPKEWSDTVLHLALMPNIPVLTET